MAVQTIQPSPAFGQGADASQAARRSTTTHFSPSSLSYETSFASTQSSNGFVHVEPPSRASSVESAPPSTKPRLLRSLSATPGAQPRVIDEIKEVIDQEAKSEKETSHLERDGGWHMRHGWDYSAEQLRELSSNYFLYYNDPRHDSMGNPAKDRPQINTEEWRMRDRLKTQQALLAICLNIGVDPPDVIKTNPSAKLEGWTDPQGSGGLTGIQPMSAISKALQSQYEQISMRTRFQVMSDPTVEEMKKQCSAVRKRGKEERVLFHYNGHGVPRPTPSGEIWVFNKHYTQYIPVSLFDLQAWLEAPSLLVYDCSDAGLIIKNYNKFVEKHVADQAEALLRDPSLPVKHYADCIHLAACRAGETLPTNPLLPADLFTCCLTTPIDIAVRFFILQNPLSHIDEQDQAKLIPGIYSNRRTPMGELNWIFTAITDTIAWNSLPRSLFKKLFRQDLMVAALFRNFLLAQRIMRKYDLHPQCYPEIPSCHEHPLWQSWDLAIELVLSQVPSFVQARATNTDPIYHNSEFFAEQLTAFEIYLDQDAMEQKEPEQLPIVLQVLLSQVHRLRALMLLSRFLDLGPWAVKLALGIGIFPYVLKLLQSQAMELKHVMVFIWCRILAVDQTCQADLLKDNGYGYFLTILNPETIQGRDDYDRAHELATRQQGFPVRTVHEHRAMCAFIIAMFCKDHPAGQDAALMFYRDRSPEEDVTLSEDLVDGCLKQISWPAIEHPILRQWSCLCLSMLWKNHDDARWTGIRRNAHSKLCDSLWDPVPEVRAALIHAITNLVGITELTRTVAEVEEGMAARLLAVSNDGSNLVRKEIVIFFSVFVKRFQNKIVVAAYEALYSDEDCPRVETNPSNWSFLSSSPSDKSEESNDLVANGTIHSAIWKKVLILSVDPDPEVSRDARIIMEYVLKAVMGSPLGPYTQSSDLSVTGAALHPKAPDSSGEENRPPQASAPALQPESDSYFSLGLRRTASVAASLKNLAFGSYEPPKSPKQPTRSASLLGPGGREAGRPQSSATRSSVGIPAEKSTQPKQSVYKPWKVPVGKYYTQRSVKEEQTLPLMSSFFDWSADYFREPQMKRNEADEPGSQEYNCRLWRRNRNERILESTQKLKEQAGSSPWDHQLGSFDARVQPMKMCFHQYDNHLALTDDRDSVRIWDWKKPCVVSKFSNGNPIRSKVTGIRFINEDDQGILMTGSSDGVIKLFRDYDDQNSVYLASSYRALNDLVPSTHNAGLVFDWLQGRGWTLVAGDAKVIRVWSAAQEMCTHDIPARSGSCVTSLTADQVSGNIFAAGFGDGAVRVYDQREKPTTSRIQQWKEHTQWITNIHLQRGGQRELVSGSRGGEIKLWDVRMGKSLMTVQSAREKDTLRSLSVHEHAPVFATGSERQSVRVYNMDGSSLSAFPVHEPHVFPYPSSRAAPVASTAFHPHRMMLACSALGDSRVSLYKCAERKGA